MTDDLEKRLRDAAPKMLEICQNTILTHNRFTGENKPICKTAEPELLVIEAADKIKHLNERPSDEITLPGFTLRLMDREGSIWIERDDGEGAELSLADFTKAVERFYNERF